MNLVSLLLYVVKTGNMHLHFPLIRIYSLFVSINRLYPDLLKGNYPIGYKITNNQHSLC